MRLLLLCLCFSLSNTYKILVFSPTISRSHMISNGRIADELTKAGHEVVMFEPDFLNIFHKVNATKLARRWPLLGFSDDLQRVLAGFSGDIFEEESIIGEILGMNAYHNAYDSLCKQIIDNDEVMQQLREEKFDAFFGEQINLCGNGLAHALDIKIHFWISSCPVFESVAWAIGQPIHLSYTPAGGNDMDTKPSYWLRTRNILVGTTNILQSLYVNWRTTHIFRHKFGSDFPNVAQIAGDSDVVFVSTDEFVEIPRPIVPNQVNIGGLGITDGTGGLDEVFEKEMAKGDRGVIYFSLGTVVNTTLLPKAVMHTLATVAKSFPDYHFIARVDSKDSHARSVSNDVPNLNVFDWTPQPALLRSPRLKMFITHSGYNGVIEAARSGVPLITIPFMFDQPKNSRAVALNGWGIPIQRKVLRDHPEQLIAAVEEILTNEKYKTAAMRIQRLVKTKPFNASERLLRTTQFVLDNGGVKELLVEGRNLSFFHIYNLDIIIPFISIVSLVIFAIVRILSRVIFVSKASGNNPKVKLQ